jgi:integrase
LIDELAAHVRGTSRDDLVFTGVRSGAALRAAVFRRAGFDEAAETIGVPGLHPHELRHTAASLAKVRGIAFDASFARCGDRFRCRARGSAAVGAV